MKLGESAFFVSLGKICDKNIYAYFSKKGPIFHIPIISWAKEAYSKKESIFIWHCLTYIHACQKLLNLPTVTNITMNYEEEHNKGPC
jgi:hypothetical protein